MKATSQYEKNILQEYTYWTLFINEKQVPHVGRSYAWWKNRTPHEGENMIFSDLPLEALSELQQISRDMYCACKALGYNTKQGNTHFLLNTLYLANEGHHHNHHMHVHFVPRSPIPITIPKLNRTFEDPVWGKNYERNSATLTSHELEVVQAIMRKEII